MKKKVLLTGASGFLGNIIKQKLSETYSVTTLGNGVDTSNHIFFDLKVQTKININTSFDIVIHCAGKAHIIPKTDIEKKEFFEINQHGTARLLNALTNSSNKPQSFVFISTVAVYGLWSGKNISEEAPLKATDPYGYSKILAETLVKNWCLENKVTYTILRLPLLIGQKPKGNLRDMIVGIKKGIYVNISGGLARKSMVLAEDVAVFIPKIASIGGTFNLTDGYHPNFFELSQHIAKILGKRMPFNISSRIMFFLAKFGDIFGDRFPFNSLKLKKITSDLTFDDTKARKEVNWNPTPVLEGFQLL